MSLINQPVAEKWPYRNGTAESSFIRFARSFHPLSHDAIAYASEKFFPHRLRKSEYMVRAGQVCQAVYYVESGILRGFIKDGIKEVTTWISGERDLVTSISGFEQQKPSAENIQALEDCELVGLLHQDLEYMYEHFPEINIIARKVLQRYYCDAEERAYIARLTEASAKYKRFESTKTEMMNRVPLKYIASYLGMTLETLSRTRSKISRLNNGIH